MDCFVSEVMYVYKAYISSFFRLKTHTITMIACGPGCVSWASILCDIALFERKIAVSTINITYSFCVCNIFLSRRAK